MKTQRQFRRLLFLLGLIAAFFFKDANAATVFPIASNAVSVGIAFDGTNYLSAMLTGTNVSVQLVSPSGALIGSPTIVGANASLNVALAFGKTNYLTVWSDTTVAAGVSIFGQLISRNGAKVGSSFNLLSAQGSYGLQEAEALAFDGTNFLAVWRDQTTRNFYGQLVTPAGTLSGSEFLISSQIANGESAATAFGKTNYLVIYSSQNVANRGNINLTYGVFVSRSGAVSGPIQIGQTPAPDQSFLGVGFDGTNFLTTWQWDPYPETFGNVTNWNIFGRMVSQTGTFPGNELQLVTDVGNNIFPSLAFDGANYLLAWGYGLNVTTNTNIRFQFFDRTATAVGPRFTLFTTQGTNAPLFGFNGLIFDGARFAIAATLGNANFSGTDVYGGFIPSSTALPQLNAPSFSSGQFSLTLAGTPGINYAIQTSTNLSLANWTGLFTNSPTNGTFNFTDTNTTNTSRFYRAVKR